MAKKKKLKDVFYEEDKNKDMSSLEEIAKPKEEINLGDTILFNTPASLLQAIEGKYKTCIFVGRGKEPGETYYHREQLKAKGIIVKCFLDDAETYLKNTKDKFDTIILYGFIKDKNNFAENLNEKLKESGTLYCINNLDIKGLIPKGHKEINEIKFNIFQKE